MNRIFHRGGRAGNPEHDERHGCRRGCLITLGTGALIVLLLFAALIGIIFIPTHWPATVPVTSPNPHVKHYYLALGDSLAFGFQPDFNWDQGYAEQWWPELQRHGSRAFLDYGCNGATTQDFIHGTCPFARVRHSYFTGSQLGAAVAFLKAHPGQVSPVTLDIGADDMLPKINASDCTVSHTWDNALATVNRDLTQTILPQLTQAMTNAQGQRTGDLWMLNYYNPYENTCPRDAGYIKQVNQDLARDAAQFGIQVVNIYQAFGGDAHPNPKLCPLTWRCGLLQQSVHPNTTGYSIITHALERTAGY